MSINAELYHHGIKGQKWGIRRYQNEDGSLTSKGIKRYATEGYARDNYERLGRGGIIKKSYRALGLHKQDAKTETAISTNYQNKKRAYKEFAQQQKEMQQTGKARNFYKEKSGTEKVKNAVAYSAIAAGTAIQATAFIAAYNTPGVKEAVSQSVSRMANKPVSAVKHAANFAKYKIL